MDNPERLDTVLAREIQRLTEEWLRQPKAAEAEAESAQASLASTSDSARVEP